MLNNISDILWGNAAAIIDYKKSSLSLPSAPIKLVGQVDVSVLSNLCETQPLLTLFPGKSIGFNLMSEFITYNDVGPNPTRTTEIAKIIDALICPIANEVKMIVSALLGTPTQILRGVIDTIDNNSCIIPHSDGFVFHGTSLRIHIPLTITPKSLGVNFDPFTCKPYSWRMQTIGGVYLLNNFEPHSAMIIDHGVRSHLIFDVSVRKLMTGVTDYTTSKQYLFSRGNVVDDWFCPNTITHCISNYAMRNKLNSVHAGIAAKNSLLEQASESSIGEFKTWLTRLIEVEFANRNVLVI